MKICIDGRCLMEGRRTGVEEYTRNLLDNIFFIDKKNEYVLFLNSWKKTRDDFSWIRKYPNVTLKKFSFPNKVLNLMFWYLGWPKIDKMVKGADVVFFPNIIFGSVSKKARVVTTIHDLSFERHSEYFSRKIRWWHIFINPKRSCLRSDKIIAVSESTKNDLITFYKIASEKIIIIPSGISDEFRVINRNDAELIKIKEKYKLPYKFILCFGTIEPRKNINSLIKAFNLLQKSGQEEFEKYKLIIVGEKGWLSEKIITEINNSPFKEKINLIYSVPNEDKVYLYNLSSLFIFPSFFEGFGFPPLEAMKCGVPVICSNNSSLPEVAGGAAILVDPNKPDEIFSAIKEVLENQDFKDILIKNGFKKAQEFDWQKTAQKTLEILENKL